MVGAGLLEEGAEGQVFEVSVGAGDAVETRFGDFGMAYLWFARRRAMGSKLGWASMDSYSMIGRERLG